MQKLTVVIVVGALFALSGFSSHAAFIITNHSFETDTAGDAAVSTGLTGWTRGADSATVNTFDPGSGDFTGAGGDDSALPSPADGGQGAVWYSTSDAERTIYQDVGTFDADGIYEITLQVAIGRQKDNAFPANDYDIDLLLDTVGLTPGSPSLPNPWADTFAWASKSYTVAATSGQALRIELYGNIEGGTGEQVIMDNVTLTTNLIPEPASALLLLLGVLGLLGRRRRRR